MKSPLPRHIHFVGIGGIGMSGIAELLLNLGYDISGSDAAQSDTTKRLESLGAKISIGHHSSNITGAKVVVTSSAIRPDNVEVVEAKSKGILIIPRAEMLAELMKVKEGIAIAGMHGKTTTTSLVSTVLAHAGFDPTVVIGGKVNALGSNAKLGSGKYLVAEADESDKTFLLLPSKISVVTNIDREHLDNYKDIKEINSTFQKFLSNLPKTGLAILCIDNANVKALIPKVKARIITYGLSKNAEFRAEDVKFEGTKCHYKCFRKDKLLGALSLPMPGIHNVTNSLAAVAVATELGVSFTKIAEGLGNFGGVQRRFTIKGKFKDITVIDDYAHHPTEINATISAAKHAYPSNRIVVAFQPHRFSRTKDLFSEFVKCFDSVDLLMLAEIYAASEDPIKGITGKSLVDAISKHGHKNAHFCPNRIDIPKTLWPLLKKNDIVITMGAGDISKTGPEILNLIEEKGLAS